MSKLRDFMDSPLVAEIVAIPTPASDEEIDQIVRQAERIADGQDVETVLAAFDSMDS